MKERRATEHLKCEYFLVSFLLGDGKLNIFGLRTKQDILGRRFGALGNTDRHFSDHKKNQFIEMMMTFYILPIAYRADADQRRSQCLFVGWFVGRITRKLRNGFPQNLDGGHVSAQNRPC